MDKATIEARLAQTERLLIRDAWVIARQRAVVAVLEGDGHHEVAASARVMLREFEKLRAVHVADRDRLKKELAKASD